LNYRLGCAGFQRFPPLIFRKGLPRHATDHFAFLGEALLPKIFVG
jgi:hypothetical protein